jgi:carbon starvation protein
MFGIANQLLAAIALAVGTTYILTNSPKKIYALCTALPLAFVLVTVFAAGIESIQRWYAELALPGLTASQTFSLKLNCTLAGIMLVLSAIIALDAGRRCCVLLRNGAKISNGDT